MLTFLKQSSTILDLLTIPSIIQAAASAASPPVGKGGLLTHSFRCGMSSHTRAGFA